MTEAGDRLGRAAGQALAAVRTRLAHMTLRSRVGLLAALGVGVAIALSSLGAFVTVSSELHHQVDANLLERARAAADSPELGDPRALVTVSAAALGAGDVRIAIVRSDTFVFSAKGDVGGPLVGVPELRVARGESTQSVRTATDRGVRYRVVAVRISRDFALLLAQSTAAVDQTLDRLGLVLLLVGAAGIALAATGGLAIARAGLRPVDRLTKAAERVARTGELAPIAVDGHDELARLAQSFNAMLAALARSRQLQQQLVADAGHELRTPLTSLRTNLDLLAQSIAAGGEGLPAEERDALLGDVRAQVEELSVLVQDIVELARDEPPSTEVELLDLADVCERALDRVRRRAPGVTFDVRLQPWPVRGDSSALERAVTNLLDNAAKWSPEGGTVTVTLAGGELRVADQGPGIDEQDLPHIFERFYRASEARTMPGSGLGLAIVRKAVQRHGGAVAAGRAEGGGALMVVRLPAARPEPARRPEGADGPVQTAPETQPGQPTSPAAPSV